MYNTASEIVELINLMLSNDKCKLLNPNTIFNQDELINGPELAKQINGYISYIRGETLDKFPKELLTPLLIGEGSFLYTFETGLKINPSKA